MDEPVSVTSISLSVTDDINDITSCDEHGNQGIFNQSFIGDEEEGNVSTAAEPNKPRTSNSSEFMEIDLTEEASPAKLPYFCKLHSVAVSEFAKSDAVVSETLTCPKECYYHILEEGTAALSIGESSDQCADTLNFTSYNGSHCVCSSENPLDYKCKCRNPSQSEDVLQAGQTSTRSADKLYQDIFSRRNKLADGVILQFCTPTTDSRGGSSHSIPQLCPVYGVKYFDGSGSADLHVYPPPTYRSIIESTIADAPPSYELVTGISTNVNEIVDDSQKKREFSSRNWSSVNISRSGRLLIVLILVITLIIGSILVLLAVLK